jgi:threonyl-tRNA synthetase
MSQYDITKLRHSTAHLLAMAVSILYKDAKLGICSVTDTGFSYDIEFNEPISSDALTAIHTKMTELIVSDLPFTTFTKSKSETDEYFTTKEQPYKRELLNDLKQRRIDLISIGNQFTDMCVSPVVSSTLALQYFMLESVSGAYWKSDDKRSMLTRITGVSFASEVDMNSYVEFKAELNRRDHRNMGKKLKLFSINSEVGSGFVSWHRRGAFVKNKLVDMVRSYINSLHADAIETPMLSLLGEQNFVSQPITEQFVAKNLKDDSDKWFTARQEFLPAHLMEYSSRERSYRDLPWRVSEIGKLIRYEKIGDLEALLRTREITQDAITIVCSREQVEKELELLLMKNVQFLRELGFTDYDIQLNQPIIDTKNQRQDSLYISGLVKGVARKTSVSITENTAVDRIQEPEIIITVRDSLKQKRELSKIQLMLSTPFEKQLSFMGKDGAQHVPVVIRSTFTGTLERLMAILIEHYAGVLPLWLSFEQIRVLPVTNKQEMYADRILKQLQGIGFRATLDADAEPLEGKIKQAEEDKVPYMLVIGEREQDTSAVSVRVQGKGDIGLISLEVFVKQLQQEIVSKSIKTLLI